MDETPLSFEDIVSQYIKRRLSYNDKVLIMTRSESKIDKVQKHSGLFILVQFERSADIVTNVSLEIFMKTSGFFIRLSEVSIVTEKKYFNLIYLRWVFIINLCFNLCIAGSVRVKTPSLLTPWRSTTISCPLDSW